MKCVSVFEILVGFSLAFHVNGQHYWENFAAEGVDLFRTPSFFSPGFDISKQFKYSNEDFTEKPLSDNEIEDSVSESSEQAPSVVKNFYFHAAPDEQPVQRITKEVMLGPSSVQNYNVIFIKAPAQPRKLFNIKAVYPPLNEKTVVYVLSRKPEEAEIESFAAIPERRKALRPDVFFVNYKTIHEAEHIQKRLQAQYDYLGGTSNVHSPEVEAPLDKLDEKEVPTEHEEPSIAPESSTQTVRYTEAISSTGTNCKKPQLSRIEETNKRYKL